MNGIICAALYFNRFPETSRLYTVPDPDAPALRILRNSGEECVFLDDNLCTIYEARPRGLPAGC